MTPCDTNSAVIQPDLKQPPISGQSTPTQCNRLVAVQGTGRLLSLWLTTLIAIREYDTMTRREVHLECKALNKYAHIHADPVQRPDTGTWYVNITYLYVS